MVSNNGKQHSSIEITVNTPGNEEQEQLLLDSVDSRIISFSAENPLDERRGSSAQCELTAQIPIMQSYGDGVEAMPIFNLPFVAIKIPGIRSNLKMRRNRLLNLISKFYYDGNVMPYLKGEAFVITMKIPRHLLLDNCEK